MAGEYFSVDLKNVPSEILLEKQNAFFHGINKSGSGAMGDVIHDAFYKAKRANLIFSKYHGCPYHSSELLKIIERSQHSRGMLFIDHYLYGTRATQKAIGKFVTVFRHPLPRLVSCYSWHARKQADYPSLERFIEEGAGKNEAQILQFGVGFGPDRKELLKSLSPKQIYERAIENVERDVRCFGIAEHFEESIFIFAHLFRLPFVKPWKKDERNKGRPLVDELPARTRKLIEDTYHYDFKFYADVVKKFKTWTSKIEFGPQFRAYQDECKAQYKDRLLA